MIQMSYALGFVKARQEVTPQSGTSMVRPKWSMRILLVLARSKPPTLPCRSENCRNIVPSTAESQTTAGDKCFLTVSPPDLTEFPDSRVGRLTAAYGFGEVELHKLITTVQGRRL